MYELTELVPTLIHIHRKLPRWLSYHLRLLPREDNEGCRSDRTPYLEDSRSRKRLHSRRYKRALVVKSEVVVMAKGLIVMIPGWWQ